MMNCGMAEIIYKEESYRIIGACMKVHSELGPGFLESVYQEALEKQFIKENIPYQREKKLNVEYDGEILKKGFRVDFLCYDKIMVELKASAFVNQADYAQLKNYLKTSEMQLGILVCFGGKSLVYKRIINPPIS